MPCQNHLLNVRACKVFLRSAEAAALEDAEVQAVLANLHGGGGLALASAAPGTVHPPPPFGPPMAGRPQSAVNAASLYRGESSTLRQPVAAPYPTVTAAPQSASASPGQQAGGIVRPYGWGLSVPGQLQPHNAIEAPAVRWGPPPPQPRPRVAVVTGAAAFRGRESSSSSGDSSGATGRSSGQEATTASNSSGGRGGGVGGSGGSNTVAGFTIKRPRSSVGGGGGIFGSVGQRAIEQTFEEEISQAEAKLRALQLRCRELEQDNSSMAAAEAVYSTYTKGG